MSPWPFVYVTLALTGMAFGKTGLRLVLAVAVLLCVVQPDFRRMLHGLWLYRNNEPYEEKPLRQDRPDSQDRQRVRTREEEEADRA